MSSLGSSTGDAVGALAAARGLLGDLVHLEVSNTLFFCEDEVVGSGWA